MTNEGFREYVNGNMLFWAANVRSTEGYRGMLYCVLQEEREGERRGHSVLLFTDHTQSLFVPFGGGGEKISLGV